MQSNVLSLEIIMLHSNIINNKAIYNLIIPKRGLRLLIKDLKLDLDLLKMT